MDPITAKSMSAAGGAAEAATYVDDVFSTFVYDGTGADQSIVNGIDLSGEGGAVWIKSRDQARDWNAFDTERGVTKRLIQNGTYAEQTEAVGSLSAFNSNGFTVGDRSDVGVNNEGYCSWTFRKAPGFFDVVTYTGTGTARTVAHNLGSVPGTIIVKRTNTTSSWYVYHRSLGATKEIRLNSTNAENTSSIYWNDTEPTSSVFTVGTSAGVNGSGDTYVAYVFAHDDQSFGTNSDEAIIKCGSYSGTNSNGNFVNLGFEPQWVLTKNANRSANWSIWDNMRGVMTDASNDVALHPNTADTDNAVGDVIEFNSTGFTLNSGSALTNWNSGETFIYIAIRRPHKPPTAGTEVFDDVAYTGNSGTQDISISPSIADSVLIKRRTAGDNWGWANRLTGSLQHLTPNSSAAEATRAAADAVEFDRQSAFGLVGNSSGEVNYSGATLISYSFKRAPGFFDIVAYDGTGSARTISHNLGAVPKMMIVKKRDTVESWSVYHEAHGNNKNLWLNDSSGGITSSRWNNTTPTDSVFSVGTDTGTNSSGGTYIAYLFGDVSGISKVGSYTGTGSDINVDCGFTAGARFVLIKRYGSTGDWYVWDTARGIVAGNDPYLELNTADAEVTSTDYIDPLNSGFTVTSSAPAALNTSGGTYIFLAIA